MYEIPFADEKTEEMDLIRRTWDDLMNQRKRFVNRAVDWVALNERVGTKAGSALVSSALAQLARDPASRPATLGFRDGDLRSFAVFQRAAIVSVSEDAMNRALEKAVKNHPMGDWLVEAKTAGARVATVLTVIRNPHRFPGQRCSEGHYLLPTFDEGEPCPYETIEKVGDEPVACGGSILAPRPYTGVRSVWHMMGMYPITKADGSVRLAKYLKEAGQGSHNVAAKTAILMPQGIAQQFYMHHSRYEDPYREAKERLSVDRPDWKPMHVDMTARVIAAKAWLGDLLIEWKRRVPLSGSSSEVEVCRGERAVA